MPQTMKKTLGELAEYVGGRLEGPPDVVVRGIAGIADASSDEVTFLSNLRYEAEMSRTRAGAVLVGKEWKGATDRPLIRVSNPYLAFARLSALFHERPYAASGISSQAWVHESARIGADVSIYPFAYVGPEARIGSRVVVHPFVHIGSEVTVGDDCILYPHVSVLERCRLGSRVIIHSGTVVGSDGFGYAQDGERHVKIPQVGFVQVDDDVEIGANCTIDRATLGRTWIAKGSKIDNLVQVAHNVTIGENSVVVAQVGISGSTEVGRSVRIGGQAGLVGHIKVGDFAGVAAQSGVTRSVEPHSMVSGSPAVPHQNFLRASALFPRLPELIKRMQALEDRLQKLERKERGG